MAPFLPIRAISRSQAVRIGKQTVKSGTTSYVDLGSQVETGGIKAGSKLPFSPFRELQNHFAIGAIFVVGPLTFTASDWAVARGVETSATKATEPEVAVTAGSVKQRSTNKEVEVEELAASKKKSTIAGKERIDYITVDETKKGKAKFTEGVAAATGKAVGPKTEKELSEGHELLVATITWVGVTETPTVANVNRA